MAAPQDPYIAAFDELLAACLNELSLIHDSEWDALADHSEWSCRAVVAHIADCLLSYALQISGTRSHRTGWVQLADPEVVRENAPGLILWPTPSGGTDALLEVLDSTAGLLTSTATTASPERRDHHTSGVTDPTGFVCMSYVELAAHSHDVFTALGRQMPTLRNDSLALILARLFPSTDLNSDDLWEEFLRATGRTDDTRGVEWDWDLTVR